MQPIKPLLATWCAIFCTLATVHGRIGETPEQITARYGPALNEHGFVSPEGRFLALASSKSEVHEKNGIYVSVEYIGGKCAWIMYIKKAARHGTAPTFGVEELATLQSVCAPNADGLAAKERISSGPNDVFICTTPDGALFTRAVTPDGGHHFKQLVAYTGEWNDQVDQANKTSEARDQNQRLSEAKKSLNGF